MIRKPVYGQATPERKQCHVAPLFSYIIQLTCHTKQKQFLGYRTHFAAISQAKLLSLSLWCGFTINPI